MTREEASKVIKDGLEDMSLDFTDEEQYEALTIATKALEQEPKTGYWKIVSDGYGDNAYICECSECKDTVWVYKDADRKWNYCPNCGAKMESEEV